MMTWIKERYFRWLISRSAVVKIVADCIKQEKEKSNRVTSAAQAAVEAIQENHKGDKALIEELWEVTKALGYIRIIRPERFKPKRNTN